MTERSEGEYYDLAKRIANLVLTRSTPEARVHDVLLFGSTMRRDAPPNDIDMLILHEGTRLREFDPGEYGMYCGWSRYSDESAQEGNQRRDAVSILHYLDPDMTFAEKWHRNFGASPEAKIGSQCVTKRIEDKVLEILSHADNPKTIVDRYADEFLNRLCRVLDLHVLSVRAFRESEELLRGDAIRSCKDPFFWHNVLSEGRMYDAATDDFRIPVEQKYPGASAAFIPAMQPAR